MPHTFIFQDIQSKHADGTFSFSYLLNTEDSSYRFVESITLPRPITRNIPPGIMDNLLHMLHLMLGISYWKLYCPKHIEIQNYSLSAVQAAFWNTIYTQGLGEFYFKNNINFRNLVSFPYKKHHATTSPILDQKQRSLVGLGGGKDSIVVAQLLKEQNKDFSTFIVETNHSYPFIKKVNNELGKKPLIVARTLDSTLIELNKSPKTYNGHIPISGIYGALGVLLCVAYDYSRVVVGNEKSSSVGNTTYLGEEINHQWSKSWAFETLFRDYIHDNISPHVTYVSLLRHLTEMQVTKLFCCYLNYFPLFSSCNRNFSIKGARSQPVWCGECPKCAFVFALLSAFLPKEQVVSIVGENLFAKKSLLHTYQELWGEVGIKPFECVGTPSEVKLALSQAHERGEYKDDIVMQYFVEHILPDVNREKLEEEVMNAVAGREVRKIIETL